MQVPMRRTVRLRPANTPANSSSFLVSPPQQAEHSVAPFRLGAFYIERRGVMTKVVLQPGKSVLHYMCVLLSVCVCVCTGERYDLGSFM